jgi:adhesin/invasin
MSIVDGGTGSPIPSTQPIAVTLVAGIAPAKAPYIRVTNALGEPVANVVIDLVVSGAASASARVTTGADGVASLVGALQRAGAYTVTATSAGLQGSPRVATITVLPGSPAGLIFVSSPTSPVTAGTYLAPAPSVAFVDAFGNLNTAATNSVAISLNSPSATSGATLSGATTATASAGVAVFNGLSVNVAATGYKLTASAVGLTSATSGAFDVVAAPGGKLVIAGTAPTALVNGTRLGPITIQVRDGSGNMIAEAGRLITVRIVAGPAATLSGTLTQTTNTAGTVIFSDLTISAAGNGACVLQFSTPGFSPTTITFPLHGGP